MEQGRLIDLFVTHQEMADAVNMTRVTVTRLLQQFETEGMLQRHSKRLVLCGGYNFPVKSGPPTHNTDMVEPQQITK